jgi:hypothetical protein
MTRHKISVVHRDICIHERTVHQGRKDVKGLRSVRCTEPDIEEFIEGAGISTGSQALVLITS